MLVPAHCPLFPNFSTPRCCAIRYWLRATLVQPASCAAIGPRSPRSRRRGSVLFVRAKPDNQQDTLGVVDGHNQAIVIAFDVKHHSLAGNDAGRVERRLQFCRILPGSLFGFGIPSIQMLLYTVLSRLSKRLLTNPSRVDRAMIRTSQRDTTHPPFFRISSS